MHVTLLHNPKAGVGALGREDLVRALLAAGHAVAYQSTREKGFEAALRDPGDVVMVAGGDGTVRKAASLLAGRAVPIALLPLGTANNISKTLGFGDSAAEAIGKIATAPRLRFDMGVAKGAWGEMHFLEGVGLGVFPVTMCLAETRADNRQSRTEHDDLGLTRDLRYLEAVLRRMRPRAWQVHADGADLSGEYYLCEALNIRSVGPNLFLAPEADPSDGLLDLVLVGENERPRLRHYLAARVAGHQAELFLPTHRAREIRIIAAGAEVHVDDRLERPHEKPSAVGGHVDLSLVAGAVEFLSL